MEHIEFEAAPENIEERIDVFLAGEMEGFSRSYIQKLLKQGNVLVNQKPAKANYRLDEGDQIHVAVPEAVAPEIVPEDIAIDIL